MMASPRAGTAHDPGARGQVSVSGPRVYLLPGEFAVSGCPCTLATIVGSCLAVCLRDPVLRIGGLSHHLLPRAPWWQRSSRFGDVAVSMLIDALAQLGAVPERLEARIYGGACVLTPHRAHAAHVGRRNATEALGVLDAARIGVVAMDVGGDHGRRVEFNPHAGSFAVVRL